MSVHALRAFDRRQIFRFFIDGRLLTRYRGWLGYEANEPGSVPAMLRAYCLMLDNFDLSQGLRAGYLKQLHKACTLNVGMRNPKTAPGDMRYLESAYTLHAGITTLDSLRELFDLRRNDQSPLFFTEGYDKTVEELDVQQVYKAIQDLGELKYRPWYPRLTEQQANVLDTNGTRIFHCTFEEFYRTKLDIQLQYAVRVDAILDEFNTGMPAAATDDAKLLAISKVVRKLELLHPFPDGNGRTFVSALMNHLLLYHGFLPAICLNPNWDAELSYREWVDEMKRGMDNTRLLLRNPRMRLHTYSIDDADENSIAAFQEMTAEFGKKLDALCERLRKAAPAAEAGPADAAPRTQGLLRLLRRCDPALVREEEGGILLSDAYDPRTGTLSASLDCSGPGITDDDIAALAPLRHIHGDLTIGGGGITRLDALDGLRSVSGTITLTALAVETLSGFSRLETAGAIDIGGLAGLTGINGFNSLLAVSGDVRIAGHPRLLDINGFNTLATVGGSLVIADNRRLCGINGFNALRQVERGSLEIRGSKALAQVNGMRLLQRVGGGPVIADCRDLQDFSFLGALEQVRHVTISGTGLRDGSPLRRLFGRQPAFPGYIKITGNAGLADVRFLAGLQSVASSLHLHQNRLASLDGLEALEQVGASFTLSANDLTDLSPLARLKSIEGVLSLSKNRLSSLKGLESLEFIRTIAWDGAPLSIKLSGNRDADGNILLTDISALTNLKAADGHLVIMVDEPGQFTRRPADDSAYCGNRIDIVRQR